MQKVRTGILVILDGFGVNPSAKFNAIAQANMPTWRKLLDTYPHGTLEASEHHVGLPPGFMGNSEVGHLNIGAGRVVYQDFSLISKAITDGSFFENPALVKVMNDVKTKSQAGTLHLMGLVSDGGVHSHISHLMALIQMAKRQGLERVMVHVFTDGRDTSPVSAVQFIEKLQDFMRDARLGEIATVSGRFYAMDRDSRWDRTQRAYEAMVVGDKAPEVATFSDPVAYIRGSYDQNINDEFIIPAARRGYRGMEDGDGIIFFNFRADRARQITRALTQPEFQPFRRAKSPTLVGFVCMTPYDSSLHLPTAYEKAKVPNTLGEVISRLGNAQLRIAETEKYAHVTYFFNGGEERVFENEKRVLIPSPREVATYDLKPEMSATLLTDSLLKELDQNDYQLVVVNFANPDMVGHTGNLKAAVHAVETVDKCLKRIVEWVEANKAFAIITADHGNCELMQDDTGLPLTSHTLLPVPFLVVDPLQKKGVQILSGGKLSDIAPSMLALWHIAPPAEMTGHSLVAQGV
jgi:2,3-bisphosphoglycerate-independent phosphoglycerate mutase